MLSNNHLPHSSQTCFLPAVTVTPDSRHSGGYKHVLEHTSDCVFIGEVRIAKREWTILQAFLSFTHIRSIILLQEKRVWVILTFLLRLCSNSLLVINNFNALALTAKTQSQLICRPTVSSREHDLYRGSTQPPTHTQFHFSPTCKLMLETFRLTPDVKSWQTWSRLLCIMTELIGAMAPYKCYGKDEPPLRLESSTCWFTRQTSEYIFLSEHHHRCISGCLQKKM